MPALRLEILPRSGWAILLLNSSQDRYSDALELDQ
jgi:hypothetical protein